MKKYLLFCFESHESGGWADFCGDYDTIEEARGDINEWLSWEIVDLDTKTVVEEG